MTNIKPIDILIVEDELLIARQLASKLKKLGYNIIDIVSSGEDAIQVAKEKCPRIILMDIVIQGDMNGIETAGKIYNKYRIPVIYLTAYADDDTLKQAEETGCYGYILKPFQERELHATIKMALRKHEKETELMRSIETARQMREKLKAIINTSTDLIANTDQLELEKDLYSALEREELKVYYQPLVNISNRQFIGVEALLRWQHHKRGLVSPNTFIPIAEETGLIESIGEWVLRQSCMQIKDWQNTFSFPLKISVNLSSRQLKRKALVQEVSQVLIESKLDPKLLTLELTESLLMDQTISIIEIINQLKSLGLNLAIDDFGTGYSSLSYLHQFPFDILKIDKCFMRNITHNADKVALTKAIIQIGHSLNLSIIAEGVENEKQIEFLEQNQCHIAQGYLFGPPIPVNHFQEFCQNSSTFLA
ncbi:two-component system response regulator [Dapis sp. BLCC M126]|uniref:two-component system response regulator n=1 Tax=Dapis sp. BLCC M126 TaxID=3400189 RepID=UPI003CF6D682